MVLILVSLLFLILFGFLGAMVLSYSIYNYEKVRVDEITNIAQAAEEQPEVMTGRAQYSSSIRSKDNNKSKGKMPKKINDFYQSSMVVLRDQDYKGWFQKFMFNFKKVTSNIGLYTKYSYNFLMGMIQKPDNHMSKEPEIEIEANESIKQRSDRVQGMTKSSVSDYKEFHKEAVEVQEAPKPEAENATINMVSGDDNQNRERNVYNKLEEVILTKLKANGMDCWPIWMELAAHYEKYKEYDKAVEIFAMVMKNSKGPEKNIAKDKLIALS